MRLTSVSSLLLLSVVYACSSGPPKDVVEGSESKVTSRPFDKNDVVDDTSLKDVSAMSESDVQKFLEKTPWGTRSVLADYQQGGKKASTIMYERATSHGINPLAMLVRVQMEQGLVSKKTATAATIEIAFGCGCPHSPACNASYMGFEAQAECAAGTLERSLAKAITSEGTVSGWARGRTKETQDGISVTPKNAATAALYTYTPWVGEAGGGRAGVGGASLHYQVWDRFQAALASSNDALPNAGQNEENSNNAQAPAAPADPPVDPPADPPEDPPADPTPDPTPTPAVDAGPTTAQPGDAGTSGDAGPTKAGTSDGTHNGSDDSAVLGEGNAPPSSNGPPPKSTSATGHPEELPEATSEELAGKPKSSQGGCAMTQARTGYGSDAGVVGLALAVALVVSRKRRAA